MPKAESTGKKTSTQEGEKKKKQLGSRDRKRLREALTNGAAGDTEVAVGASTPTRSGTAAAVSSTTPLAEGDEVSVDVPTITTITTAGGESQQQQQQGGRTRELSKRLWAKDPLYRIVRKLPRGDVVHLLRSKLQGKDCAKAAGYMAEAAPTKGDAERNDGVDGMLEVRLQVFAPLVGGLDHFLPLLSRSRYTLRKLDLSRNQLKACDVAVLAEAFDFSGTNSPNASPKLEVLDLSYNPQLGNDGAVAVLAAVAGSAVLKALSMKHCGITDAGCTLIATHLAQRPFPVLLDGSAAEPTFGGQSAVGESDTFFLNLNENCVGSVGQVVLSRHLPSFVSLTLAKQKCFKMKKHTTFNQCN